MMIRSLSKYSDWAMLLLRVVLGIIFIYHGWMKWGMGSANLLFTTLKIFEPIAGVLLIIGAFAQIVSIILALEMLGAIYMKMTGFGSGALHPLATFVGSRTTGWEFDLMIVASLLVLLVMGAGKLSVDEKVCGGK